MPRWNIVATDGAQPGSVDTKGYIELLGIWSATNGSGSFRVDDLGNVTAAAVTATTVTSSGVQAINAGTNTSASAPIIAATGFSSGVASQLSDLTRDYMCYIRIGTGGGTVTLSIGATSAGTDVTIMSAAVGVNGELIAVRLPAGWYLKITVATSTIASQVAVGC